MKKTIKLLRVVGGLASTAGIFGLGILGCVAYGIKNGTIENPLKKRGAEEKAEEENKKTPM